MLFLPLRPEGGSGDISLRKLKKKLVQFRLCTILSVLVTLAGCQSPWIVSEEAMLVFSTDCNVDGIGTIPAEVCIETKRESAQVHLDYEHAEQIQMEREDVRRLIRGCHAANAILIVEGTFVSSLKMRRFHSNRNTRSGYPYIPEQLKMRHLSCISHGQFRDWMRGTI